MASFPFSQAPFSARFEFYVHSQLVSEWPGGQSASETPRGRRKSGLAFMVVILQVKGTLIYISQSDLLPAKGEKLGELAPRLF